MYQPQLSNVLGDFTAVTLLEGAAAANLVVRSRGAGVGNTLSLSSGAGNAGAGGAITLSTGAGTTISGALTLSTSDVAAASAGNVVFAPGRGSAAANDGAVVLQANAAARPADLRFNDNDNSNYVALKAPSVIGTSFSLALPNATGAVGEVLYLASAGQLGWSTALTAANHLTLDQLVHAIVETSYEEYTYSGNQVTSIVVWQTPAMLVKVREELFTYSGTQVTQIVTKQYDGVGAVVETMTEVFTYSGTQVADITRTFV
jgi:hypothetical protein